MEISQENTEEIKKLIKYIEQMEKIVKTSSNASQVERVRKEVSRFRARLNGVAPSLDAERSPLDEIKKKFIKLTSLSDSSSSPVPFFSAQKENVELYDPAERRAAASNVRNNIGTDLIDRITIDPASPHCTDLELNFLASMLKTVESEYWPVLNDQHTKLDYSHAAIRDNLRKKLENGMRNLQVLSETIEEYSTSENQDFREQLLKMKNKQGRIFLMETNELFLEIIEFLVKLIDDINKNGTVVRNRGEVIKFNPRFEEATMLEGQTISYAITEFDLFLNQVVNKLNLGNMRSRF